MAVISWTMKMVNSRFPSMAPLTSTKSISTIHAVLFRMRVLSMQRPTYHYEHLRMSMEELTVQERLKLHFKLPRAMPLMRWRTSTSKYKAYFNSQSYSTHPTLKSRFLKEKQLTSYLDFNILISTKVEAFSRAISMQRFSSNWGQLWRKLCLNCQGKEPNSNSIIQS